MFRKCVFLASLLSLGVTPPTSQASGRPGRILNDGSGDAPPVQSGVATSVGNLIQITLSSAEDTHPSWTPDGNFIVFCSDRTGNWQIYKIPATGGVAQQLTLNTDDDRWPEVSPLGDLVVYSKKPDATRRIWVVGINGGTETQISTGPSGQYEDWTPTFSTDGNTIYFSRRVGSVDWDLYQVPTVGGPVTFVLGDGGTQYSPQVSPSGAKIAFASRPVGEDYNLFEADLPSSGAWTQLTFETSYTNQPGYAPNGSRLVYASRRINNRVELYELDLTFLTSTRLTFDTEGGADPGMEFPTYSPDGTKIAFASARVTGERNIWVLDLLAPPPSRS